MTVIYGIKNCDTMKKAFKWLDEKTIDYVFHDYKKGGVDDAVLRDAIAKHGWENVINRRGTTWRALPDEFKNSMNTVEAIKIASEKPSIIKRPLLTHAGEIYLGFDADRYSDIFE